MVFWSFLKFFFIGFFWNQSKMKNLSAINISAQTPCQKKFWFLSYGPNCSDRIKLQDSLESNIL